MEKGKRPLTVSEYAKKEGITRQGVYDRIARKDVKTVKIQPKVNHNGIWYNYGKEKTFILIEN
jgi:predicted DNA-binding protein YlxM (UPF0122 family)